MFQEPVLQSQNKVCLECGWLDSGALTNCPNDGSVLTNPFARDPAFIGKYELAGLIGSGGMGVIFKARQIAMNKMVAVKMIHAHMISQESFQRFQLEGKAIGLLNHPSIINIHDFGATETGQPYMIMDYVEGKTMSDVLKRDGYLSKFRFQRIFQQICDGLAHAHKRGVLHRDIKPSNIMLIRNEQGQEAIRIMDFGIAKLSADTEGGAQNLTKTGEAIGSPIYMSPEQARGMKVDSRSDIYSLGCVMYEALSGSPPFVGATPLDTMLMHLNEMPLPLREASLGLEIEPAIEKIVMRLLEKEPEDRYQSMDEVSHALKNLDGGEQASAPAARRSSAVSDSPIMKPRAGSTTTSQGKTAKPILFAAIAVVACVVAAIPFVILTQNPAPKPESAQPSIKQTQPPERPEAVAIEPSPPVRKEFEAQLANGGDELNLRRAAASTITLEDLKGLDVSNVRTMLLDESNMDDDLMSQFKCPKLVRLDLVNTQVKTLAFLSAMPALRRLSLGHTNTANEQAINNICHLQELTTLDMSGCRMTFPLLVKLKNAKKLTTLKLLRCPSVSPEQVAKFQTMVGDRITVEHSMAEP